MNNMNLVTKIEDRLAENKSGVKTYATYESAEKIGNKLGSDYAARCGKADAVEFIVVFLPKTKRFSQVEGCGINSVSVSLSLQYSTCVSITSRANSCSSGGNLANACMAAFLATLRGYFCQNSSKLIFHPY